MAACAMAEPSQGMYGAYGMGPGMMGGYGMGQGMMEGYAQNYGMGPGMMGNNAQRANLNLTAEQRSKIGKIQTDMRRKHWDLMGKMQDEQAQMNDQFNSDKRDDAAVSKSYRKISEIREQMFETSLSAQSQIDAVLTKEQREKQRRD